MWPAWPTATCFGSLAARWLGLEARAARYFSLGPASVSELGWEREQPVIASWNLRLTHEEES